MTLNHQPYMLDTNIFNHLLDGQVSSALFEGRHLLVLGIQADELRKTGCPERRTALLERLEALSPETIPASSFAFDIEGAGYGQAYWNDGSGHFAKMRQRLCELDTQAGKKPRPLNLERDILIAEAAIKNNAVLVSGDQNLRQVVSEFGGLARDCAQLEPIDRL